jgi:hypothetical protein
MRLRIVMILLMACVAAVNLTLTGEAAAPAESYHEVWISAGSAEDIAALTAHGIIVHEVADRAVRAWVRESTLGLLNRAAIPFYPVEAPDEIEVTGKQNGLVYGDYDSMTQSLQNFHSMYPDITELYTLGQSVQGRELWAMLITENPGVPADKPAFKYVSTMHGDEPDGTPIMLALIERLLTGYMVEPRITELVNETEIWIVPLMNPDRYMASRGNANGIDLNRNFPVFPNEFTGFAFDGAPLRDEGREPETQHVMRWSADRNFVLSANIHTGALVVNYPYDDDGMGSNFSPTPDQDIFEYVSLVYAMNNPPMFASTQFENGITNGADWFRITGGMQDWNYRYLSCKEVTLELAVSKTPQVSRLPQLWENNEESLLAYMEQVQIGVRGIITDADTGEPVEARVRVSDRAQPVFSNPDVGNYHRLLLPGEYTLIFEAPGYASRTVEGVVVEEGPATRLDVTLVSTADAVMVPDVTGLDEAAATAAIEAAGLVVQTITRQFNDAQQGVVLVQSPVAGSPLAPGSGVTLQVSHGRPGGFEISFTGADTGAPVTGASIEMDSPYILLFSETETGFPGVGPAGEFVVTVLEAGPYATPASFPFTLVADENLPYNFELVLPPPGDINGDGVVNAVDVQLVINAALGVDINGMNADINGDGVVNAVDVQLVINAALGLSIG